MECNSGKMFNFASWLPVESRHRGEQLSFDPSENLENSVYKGKKSESCSSCSKICTAARASVQSVHAYTCRCELIFFILTYTGISRTFRLKNVKKAHTLCPYV